MGRSYFGARRLVVAVVKTERRRGIASDNDLMAAFDELVDSRGQQGHAKLLFLNLPRYAHDHVATIFSRLLVRQVLCLDMEME